MGLQFYDPGMAATEHTVQTFMLSYEAVFRGEKKII